MVRPLKYHRFVVQGIFKSSQRHMHANYKERERGRERKKEEERDGNRDKPAAEYTSYVLYVCGIASGHLEITDSRWSADV